MRKLYLTMSLLLSLIAAQAADFSGTLLGGEFFFNIVDEDAATCEFAPNPNGPYNVTLNGAWLPSTVNYNGKDYTIIGVGEGAFRDGYVTNGANNATARQREFWGFPTTLQYVRADAFNGFRSNFPALLRGNVMEFDVTAMRNNKITAINAAGQGGTYRSTEQPQGYTVNSNTDTYTATSALAASAGSIIYKEREGGGKVLVAYPGDHRRTYHHTYQSGQTVFPLDDLYNQIITEVNATGYVEIGENAFYGNENVTKVNFDQSLTTIGAHAFENSVLTTLVLPATITTIGEDAFKGVTTLASITCNAVTPPVVVFEDAVYDAIHESGNITVPEDALATYQTDANWGRFWSAAPPAGQRVTIVEAENGEVTADNLNPADGATVTLTVTPQEGYRLKTITAEAIIDPGNASAPRRIDGPNVGIPVELTAVVEGQTYTFVMPNAPYDVIVKSEFEIAEYTITVAETENGTVTAPPTATMGQTVTLTVNPAEGYELETLTYTVEGGEAVPIENNEFTMPGGNVTINATFKAIDYNVTVAEGIENGTVVADKSIAHVGETVTLTVTPAEGYELESITVTGVNTDVVAPVNENNEFTMPADDVTINATFKAIVYNVTVAEGIENGTVVADKSIAHVGETVTLTVTPAEGYELESITVNGVNTDVVAPVNENNEFTMPADDVIINATFKAIDYNVTVAEGIENGTVVADKSIAHVGETVKLTITPAEGYELEGITVNGVNTDVVAPLNENNEFTMPADDVIINATFTAIDYTITVAEGIENGTVTAPAGANYGDVVPLTVEPAEGYELETLTYTVEGGEAVPIENNEFVMPAGNVTINATFKSVEYTITVAEGIENGAVTAPATAHYGDVVALDVNPDEGYQLKSITVTGVNTDVIAPVNESNEFTMPADDVIVTAEFELIPPVENIITIAETENGTVTVFVGENEIQSGASVAEGTIVKVVLEPDTDYEVETFSVDTPDQPSGLRRASVPVTPGEEGVYTFEMPGEPVTITATFTEKMVTAIRDLRAAGYDGEIFIDINGRVSDRPFKGINIVVNADGKVTKMVK